MGLWHISWARRICSRRAGALGAVGLLALVAAARLGAVAPNFASATPPGGQRGTEVEVRLQGERLADTREIFFYEPGIVLEQIIDATDKQVRVRLKIAADCRLGEHRLRLRTAGGISALRLFFVGPLPTVEEKEPNNSSATAQPVAINTTVHGTIAAEDEDWFSVAARQGQRLVVEVEGARLGRTMFDPILRLHDPAGRVIAKSDDSPLLGHDAYVAVVAPADGTYRIQLRDVVLSGAGHIYRLHLGDFPRPAMIQPAGGRAGETLATRVVGDPLGDFEQSFPLPSRVEDCWAASVERSGVAPSPNWLRVVKFPNAPAMLPGKALGAAAKVDAAVPFAINGVLAAKGEPAFYRFSAKKSQHLDFQVFARRLGSPLDSVITVFGPKGNNLGSNDDAAGHPDSAVRVRIPDDGEYTVKISDQLNRGGPLFSYRIEITEVQPTITLSIPDTARYDNETRKSIVVPRGNRFAVLMTVNRDQCNDEVRLLFDGLPAGVTAHVVPVPSSMGAVPVVFEAAADAPIAGNLLTPTAVPVATDKAAGVVSRYRHAVDWVRIQNDTVYTHSEVGRIAAAVVEEVPFKVRIVEPQVPLVQSGEMALQIAAERAAGFDEPITVKMLWSPPGVTALPEVVIPKGQIQAVYKLNSTAKAETKPWKITVIASATVKGGVAYVAAPATTLTVAEAFLGGKIDLAKVERGQSTKVVCALEQKVPFEGPAEAELLGLPDGVTAKPVTITQESKEAVFDVTASPQSPLGTNKNVSCRVTLRKNGEAIVQAVAPGSVLRVDPPRVRAVAAAAAVPEGKGKTK